jgi:hypothetical protein
MRYILCLVFFLVGSAFGGEQSFESRYWSEIIRDKEVLAADSLVQRFIDAPECFTIKDTSGVPIIAGVSKFMDSKGSGWLLIVVAIAPPEQIGVPKDKFPLVESNSPVLIHVIQQIKIFEQGKK